MEEKEDATVQKGETLEHLSHLAQFLMALCFVTIGLSAIKEYFGLDYEWLDLVDAPIAFLGVWLLRRWVKTSAFWNA